MKFTTLLRDADVELSFRESAERSQRKNIKGLSAGGVEDILL